MREQPIIVCPSCDVGATVSDELEGSVRVAPGETELFCLKCDYIWRIKQ